MNGLMIVTGFPVSADRLNQILDRCSPVRECFPDTITNYSAFDTDILYSRRREVHAVVSALCVRTLYHTIILRP